MAMTSLAGIEELRHWGRPVVTTAEVAKRLHIAEPAASQMMSRLAEHDAGLRIQRGRWLLRPDTPMLAVPYLALPHPAYATGFWALASYGNDRPDSTRYRGCDERAVTPAGGGQHRV